MERASDVIRAVRPSICVAARAQTIVTDAHQALEQDVQKEAAQEFDGIERELRAALRRV